MTRRPHSASGWRDKDVLLSTIWSHRVFANHPMTQCPNLIPVAAAAAIATTTALSSPVQARKWLRNPYPRASPDKSRKLSVAD